MIQKIILLIVVSTLLFSTKSTGTTGSQTANAAKNSKWISLFNGKDLNGWIPKITGYKAGENPHHNFRVEDGMLRVDYRDFAAFNGRFGHLFYKEKFSSYILHMEYRFVGEVFPDAPGYCLRNSGVMVHSQSARSMDITENWPVSVEVQLLGCTDKVKQATANACTPGTTIFINDKLTNEHCISAKPKYYYNNQWVKLDVIVHGSKSVYHVVNGDTVLVWSKAQVGGMLTPENYPIPAGTVLEDGYIALQAEGQPIDFRDIRIILLDDNKISKKEVETPVASTKPLNFTKTIDTFDSYSSKEQLTAVWKPSGNDVTLGLDPKGNSKGKNGLKFGYATTGGAEKKECSIVRTGKLDLTGCNGATFWFKPDGSGREMTIQFNLSNIASENIHDLWVFKYKPEKGDTDPRMVLIPFGMLKHNVRAATSADTNKTFKPGLIIETKITIGEKEDGPGTGAYYLDELMGCKLQF